MTTPHDALCPRADIGYLPNVACWCDEIAKVRADERGRVVERVLLVYGPNASPAVDTPAPKLTATIAAIRDDRLIAQEFPFPAPERAVERSNPPTRRIRTPSDSEPSTEVNR